VKLETVEQFKKCVVKYTEKLKLDAYGWKVTVICDDYELINESQLGVQVCYNANTKVAEIKLYTKEGIMVQLNTIDEIVIHELLHLKLWYVDEYDDNVTQILNEQFINDLAPMLYQSFKEEE